LQEQGPNGGFLLGRMGSMGSASIMAEVMRDSDSLSLIGQEKLGGSLCHIVSAETKYGTVTIWIAPEKGYNALKYVVRKSGRDILREGVRLEDEGITEWVEVVDSIDVRKIDGVFIPISGQLTGKGRAGDDWKSTDHIEVKRSKIILNPDFEALGAFKISFPEGTEVTHEDIPGRRFRWTNGKFVPDMDEYTVKNLVGKPLPSFSRIADGFDPEGTAGRMVLLCFWDMDQRPSRHFIVQLAKQAEQLRQNGVAVVIVQASEVDQEKLDEWVNENNVPFPVGMVRGDQEKTRAAWGARSIPWLILADRKHTVLAEGFALDQIESMIQEATNVNR